jgi:RNA polymerase sigma-70 factor (ECF subfamily)
MHESRPTRPSLLLRIREPKDGEAWEEFAEIYGPLVRRFCVRRGLQETDAQDISQEVLLAVARAIPDFQYDPGRGTFRGWLFTVVRSKISNLVSNRAREPQGSGRTSVHEALEAKGDQGLETQWDEEHREWILSRSTEKVRGEFREATWQAFWRTAVLGEDAVEAARGLGMSVGAVYVARSRVLARIRGEVLRLTEDDERIGGSLRHGSCLPL